MTIDAPIAELRGTSDDARARFLDQRRRHWDEVAATWGGGRGLGAGYQRRLQEVYRQVVPRGRRVLELGCGTGDLLAALEPASAVGVDLSPEMIELARTRHGGAGIEFLAGDAEALAAELVGRAPFDVVVLSDILNDLWDVQGLLAAVRPLCRASTRVVINCYSHLWQVPLGTARRFGWARPQLAQNWLTVPDIATLLELSGFEVVRSWSEVLLPLRVPLLAGLCNRVLAKVAPFRWLDLTNLVVARPRPERGLVAARTAGANGGRAPRVSVVVPARNESGNIERIVDEVPQLGGGTELILVEGNSTDDTWATIGRVLAERGRSDVIAMQQPGKGKGDAVRAGFRRATGDILMILDADLTVHPTALHQFHDAIASGRGEFVNGVRLVYPMEERAMRTLNLIANTLFGKGFSWLLGQRIRDTLCGTKVLWREDYERLAANRAHFGDFDPFGDFDLIFGAAKLNLRIIDLPVRYRERTYGETNIHRWRHGLLLLRMVGVAMRRLKFV